MARLRFNPPGASVGNEALYSRFMGALLVGTVQAEKLIETRSNGSVGRVVRLDYDEPAPRARVASRSVDAAPSEPVPPPDPPPAPAPTPRATTRTRSRK